MNSELFIKLFIKLKVINTKKGWTCANFFNPLTYFVLIFGTIYFTVKYSYEKGIDFLIGGFSVRNEDIK